MAPKKAGATRKAAAPTAKKSARKTLTFAESTADEASKAVQTTRHVTFTDAKAVKVKANATAQKQQQQQRGGIVMAPSNARKAAGKRRREEVDAEHEAEDEDDDEDAEVASLVDDDNSDSGSDSGADMEQDDSDEEEEDLSDVADDSSGDDDADGAAAEDEDNPFVKAKRTGGKLAYKVLRLRFLPQEFQEPQLFKFLGQFGAEVLNCFCVRSRRTHQSKGIAYVQFDREEVLPLVLEECNGMALGGRAVRARIVTLRRAMPSKEKVAKRRKLAYAYKTKGAPLKQHNVLGKSPVALLIKAARTEASNNAHLRSVGIDFQTHFFTEQLKHVPPQLITKNTKVLVDAGNGMAPAKPAATAATATTAAAASPSPRKIAKKEAPSPQQPVETTASNSATPAKKTVKKAATPPPPGARAKRSAAATKGGRASV